MSFHLSECLLYVFVPVATLPAFMISVVNLESVRCVGTCLGGAGRLT